MRCGHAGGSIGPRCLLSDRPTLASPPAPTSTLLNQSLWWPPAMPCTRYWPGGRSLAENCPRSPLTTMKVRRLASFFNFTNAPAIGCPDASLTTPCTAPLSAAATAPAANSIAVAAMPARSLPVIAIVLLLVVLPVTPPPLWFLIGGGHLFEALVSAACRRHALEGELLHAVGGRRHVDVALGVGRDLVAAAKHVRHVDLTRERQRLAI